ncbi:hypothetical protein LshimejAT787_0312210 [Lyophyllum shimeji]|uniref:Uncharacterized protein n=1 Tax=Lyophyllum shimeji TaxID=47721 RepID=A0A9P3PK46_LYOSH|nr:hypothetical protein LshimejAT787_0312210 [Lyophyllum shimeji]
MGIIPTRGLRSNRLIEHGGTWLCRRILMTTRACLAIFHIGHVGRHDAGSLRRRFHEASVDTAASANRGGPSTQGISFG